MSTMNVTDQDFQENVLNSAKPVLVDFWAGWCGPCRMLSPILEEISSQYAEKINVAKVNVDANPEVTSTYGISSVPTIKIFKAGEVVATSIGPKPKSALESEFAEYLK